MTPRNPPTAAIRHRGAMSFVTELRYLVGSSGDRVLDLGMPAICAGCYRTGSALCRECCLALDVRSGSPDVPISIPADLPKPLLQLEWCAPLTGIARRAVDQLTRGDERRAAAPLGKVLAKRWALAGAGGDVLVPVPASAELVRERGYDHTALLARAAGQRLHLPVLEVLRRNGESAIPFSSVHEVRDVVGHPRFAVVEGPRIAGRWAILVDDVVATGATLATCANLLLEAGARAVSAVVVARDLRS
jgi:predicted amidophosphoribosyltransferase